MLDAQLTRNSEHKKERVQIQLIETIKQSK
jgi:hypothetical protein